MECKRRSVDFRRVSNPRRAFRPAIRDTGISDDWYRSTIGVSVICLGTCRSAEDRPGSAGDKPGSADDKTASASDTPGSTSNH